jgi:hypothetical protein
VKKVLSLVFLGSIVGSVSAVDLPSIKIDDYTKNPYLTAAAAGALALGAGHLTEAKVKRSDKSDKWEKGLSDNMYTAMWMAAFNRVVRNKEIDVVRVGLKGLAGFGSDWIADKVHPELDKNISFGGAAVNPTATRAFSGELVEWAVDSFCKSGAVAAVADKK